MMQKETSPPASVKLPSYVPIFVAALMVLTGIAGGYFALRNVQGQFCGKQNLIDGFKQTRP